MIERMLRIFFGTGEAGLLSEADRLLVTPEPASEAELARHRKALAAAEALLVRALDTSVTRAELLRKLAMLAERQGHVHDAIKWWSEVLVERSGGADEANLALARAYSKLYKVKRAKGHLKSVSSSCMDADSVAGTTRKVERAESVVQSLAHAERVIALAKRHDPEPVARRELDEVLAKTGLGFASAPEARQILFRAYRVATRFPEPSEVSAQSSLANYKSLRVKSSVQSARPKIVFTCGFLWSGSGAVTDLLRGMQGVHLGAGGSEMRLFKSLRQPGGLLRIFDSPAASLGPEQIMSLFLGPIMGMHSGLREIDINRARGLVTAHLDSGGDIQPLWRICGELLDRLDATDPAQGDRQMQALRALQWFAQSAVSSLAERPSDTIVMNNCIFGFHVRMLALFKDAVAITVKRDPRDQYVAEYYERDKHRVTPIDVFIKSVRQRRDAHDRAIATLGLKDRVIEIGFEDFVSDAGLRKSILEKLNMDPDAVCDGYSFDASKSQKNIGIYKDFPDHGIIRRIEEAFPDFTG